MAAPGLYQAIPVQVPNPGGDPPHLTAFRALPPLEQERYRQVILQAPPPRLFDNPQEQAVFEQAFAQERSDPQRIDLIAGRAYEGGGTFPAKELGGRIRQPAADPNNALDSLTTLALEKVGYHPSGASVQASPKAPLAGRISPQSLMEANRRASIKEAQRPGVQFLPN